MNWPLFGSKCGWGEIKRDGKSNSNILWLISETVETERVVAGLNGDQ